MQVTLEAVPTKHPRPFKEGDLVWTRENPGRVLLLTKKVADNAFNFLALSPTDNGISVGSVSFSLLQPSAYELYKGCVTIRNNEE